jgi:hypothetical protein
LTYFGGEAFFKFRTVRRTELDEGGRFAMTPDMMPCDLADHVN